MVIPSLRGEAKAGLLDLLLDEYGWGRYDHMHSTVYEEPHAARSASTPATTPTSTAPPGSSSPAELQGMLARHRRLCRRMYGYIYLVEADSPRSMRELHRGLEAAARDRRRAA